MIAAGLLLLSIISVDVLAGKFAHVPIKTRHHQHHGRGNSSPVERDNYASNFTSRVFTMQDFYQGKSFLNDFDFFSDPDPTNGLVNYQTRENAIAKNLAFVQGNSAVLAVDDFSQVPVGGKRDSVRISSKKTYNGGLFIADFFTMPHGCSAWPAYWSVGPNWPSGGEIDVVEGVHQGPTNSMTLHTSAGCSMGPLTAPGVQEQGKFKSIARLSNPKCQSGPGDNSGCGFSDPSPASYGHEFNVGVGGVFAHLWDTSGIRIWRFPRSAIPMDIVDRQPNPVSWGVPTAFFPGGDNCDIQKHFFEHSLVLDTTLCGDLGNPTYANSGCKGTCAEAVADPENFKFAKWRINYIAVYQ